MVCLVAVVAIWALPPFSNTSGDLDWVNWVLLDGQLYTRTDAQRNTISADVGLDTIEWYGGILANRGEFMRMRGIATSGDENYEFEEALQFTAEEVQEHFTNNGIALNETMQAPSWNHAPFDAGGKYFTTNIALKWRETIR